MKYPKMIYLIRKLFNIEFLMSISFTRKSYFEPDEKCAILCIVRHFNPVSFIQSFVFSIKNVIFQLYSIISSNQVACCIFVSAILKPVGGRYRLAAFSWRPYWIWETKYDWHFFSSTEHFIIAIYMPV